MVPMTWVSIAVAVAVVAVLVVGLLLVLRRGRNSGATRARDVPPVNTAHDGAHGLATQHQGNLYGGGGPF